MAILPGQRLGPYEALSMIGAGGMGEVYRAKDTRLDRIVAIKVLPAHLADRPDLRERFEREARTIASLNHPHICTLYDIGHQDGIDFLVMEYLEGETLAQRLLKGPLPLDQVLRYAIEIADALDKAHRKGVTHRDLKPGNIMLTKSGTKLLDFGLAKLKQETAPANISLSKLPTGEDNLTAQGTILGTLQYMAPEQLEAKEVDARTDIFAFGAVVYEMATGKHAFEGKSQASIIAGILERDPPPMSSLQPMTPPALDRVVKRCLAKDPDERWQAARDLEVQLNWTREGGSQVTVAPTVPARGVLALGRRALILGLGALLLVAAITSLATWYLKPSPPQPVSRLVINLPPGQQLSGLDNGPAVALSPDGTHLAYVATQGGTQQLYLRAMGSLEPKAIPGTEGAVNPFFSPDGQWLGFFAGGRLKKVSVSGGTALTLGDASIPLGASWGSQEIIVFAPTNNGVLQQVSDAGGARQPLTRFEKGEISHRWPDFLPGTKAVLFSAGSNPINWTNTQVAVQSLGTGERRNLIQGATQPRYAPSGHLVYAQGGSLMAVLFDPQRLAVTGAAVPVVEGILQSPSRGAAQYSFSATGSLVYVPGGAQSLAQSRLAWVNRNGTEQPLAVPMHAYQFPRLSPDGRRVAVGIDEPESSDVWLYDLSRETLTRLTFGESVNQNANWTPDGKRIAFRSNKEESSNLFWQLADGSGGLERLTTSEYFQAPNSWSPDGQLLAFIEVNPTTGYDIWVLRMGDRKPEPFLRTPFLESAPRFSPDGRWLAYISDESGHREVYVQPYPGPGGKRQITTEGGTEPVWNPNGRELFYRSGGRMMAVDIVTQLGFAAGKPRVLFDGPYLPSPVTFPNYDVSPDGQRFLMLKPSEQAQAAPTQINVVLNWFEELKRRVPTGK
jgi:Tol biopolymer transport system component/predicted Ser/Thr protein kinase